MTAPHPAADSDTSASGATNDVPTDTEQRSRLPLGLQLLPVLVVLVMAPIALVHPVDDPDVWWHLRAAEHLLETWRFVEPDPLSTLTTYEWVHHEWIGEVVTLAAYRLAGVAALSWLVAATTSAILAALYLALRRDNAVLVSGVVSIVALIGTTVSLTPRPQIFSFLLAAVVSPAWWRVSRDGRARWWLVPVAWLWAGVHGFWILVPGLGAVVVVGLLLERTSWRVVLQQGAVVVLSVVAAALTPVGPRLLLSGRDVGETISFVQEWLPVSAGTPAFLAVTSMLVLTAVLWTKGPAPSWPEVLLLGTAAYLAVVHGRTIPVAAMIAAPLLASALTSRLRLARVEVRGREVGAVAVALALGAALAGVVAPARASEPAGFPTGLSTELSSFPPGSVICNDYFLGGWLLFTHPDLVPAIDGRIELYTVQDVEDYLRLSAADDGWQDVLQASGCRAALVSTHGPLHEALSAAGWHEAGRDRSWVLLSSP